MLCVIVAHLFSLLCRIAMCEYAMRFFFVFCFCSLCYCWRFELFPFLAILGVAAMTFLYVPFGEHMYAFLLGMI